MAHMISLLTQRERMRPRRLAALRATPHWMERVAAGALKVAPDLIMSWEQQEIAKRKMAIAALRTARLTRALAVPTASLYDTRFARFTRHGLSFELAYKRRPTQSVLKQWRLLPPPAGQSSPYAWPTYFSSALAALRDYNQRRRRQLTPRIVVEPMRYAERTIGRRVHVTPHPKKPPFTTIVLGCPLLTRKALAHAIRRHRAALPSRLQPDTLGWRAWQWDETAKMLRSPHYHTPWPSAGMQAISWTDKTALRGEAGIHARRLPRDWRLSPWTRPQNSSDGPQPNEGPLVTGIVERYGRYILGETGWRAEHVLIRGLVAPTMAIFTALLQRYPEVPVYLVSSASSKLTQ